MHDDDLTPRNVPRGVTHQRAQSGYNPPDAATPPASETVDAALRVVSVITGPGPSVEGYVKADVDALLAAIRAESASAPCPAHFAPWCAACVAGRTR